MSHPIRDTFLHVTARGDRRKYSYRKDFFDDDTNRHVLLDILAQVVEQFNWLCIY